jgi:hypothetical protein
VIFGQRTEIIFDEPAISRFSPSLLSSWLSTARRLEGKAQDGGSSGQEAKLPFFLRPTLGSQTVTDKVQPRDPFVEWGYMDRGEFFAQLDQLTDKEIETRLPQWDREQLLLVQEYLDQKAKQTKAASSAQIDSSTKEEAVRVSVEAAKRAHSMALMA